MTIHIWIGYIHLRWKSSLLKSRFVFYSLMNMRQLNIFSTKPKLDLGKMCPIFVGTVHDFSKSDDDTI